MALDGETIGKVDGHGQPTKDRIHHRSLCFEFDKPGRQSQCTPRHARSPHIAVFQCAFPLVFCPGRAIRPVPVAIPSAGEGEGHPRKDKRTKDLSLLRPRPPDPRLRWLCLCSHLPISLSLSLLFRIVNSAPSRSTLALLRPSSVRQSVSQPAHFIALMRDIVKRRQRRC